MAGDNGAERLAAAWLQGFQKHCPNLNVQFAGGGWGMGAARVCANHKVYDAVDMAGMAGPFFEPQAMTDNGWAYQCKHSQRNTILVRQRDLSIK